MKINIILSISSIFFLLASTVQADVCWKNSYGRGIGTVPLTCPDGTVKSGLLCYPQPEPGYNVVAGIYSQSCPPDFRDDGLFCAKPAAYGRGAGYPWKFGDRAFSLDDARARCASDNSQGCDTDGAVVYPKCKPNFHAVGCCTCSPDCPAGMTDIGVSCAKKTYVKAPVPANCAANQQYDAGLCYQGCADSFNGIGPVCWGQCSPDMVDCGAMCGSSEIECGIAISDMVLSVGEVVVKIGSMVATAGASSAVTTAVDAGKSAAIATLKEVAKKLAKELLNKFAQSVTKELLVPHIAKELEKAVPGLTKPLATEIAKLAENGGTDSFDYLAFAKSLDVSGISKVVDAFNKEICGQ